MTNGRRQCDTSTSKESVAASTCKFSSQAGHENRQWRNLCTVLLKHNLVQNLRDQALQILSLIFATEFGTFTVEPKNKSMLDNTQEIVEMT